MGRKAARNAADKDSPQTASTKKGGCAAEVRKSSAINTDEAFARWEKYSAEEQERFLATLDAELAQILKTLSRTKELSKVVEVSEKIQIAALALLYRHLHVAGAKHTDLRRAFQLSNQATRFLQSVLDLLTDRQPSLVPSAQKLSTDAQAWAKRIASVFGDAKEAGPKVVPTRGKTAPGRLRSLDAFMCQYMRELLPMPANAIVVDLGFGEVAVTTVEMSRMLWRHFSDIQVIGVESDRTRAETAKRSWAEQTRDDLRAIGPNMSCRGHWTCSLRGSLDFRHGGFLMPLTDTERPKLCCVRALNVLRQYESFQECRNAHRTVTGQLMENGLLFEGSSDPVGNVVVSYVFRATGSQHFLTEALLFALNLRAQAKQGGLSLDLVADNLPQLLFKRDVNNFEVFLEHWRTAVIATDASRGVKQHFHAAACRLAEVLPKEFGEVVTRSQWLRRGWLLLKNPGGMT